MHREAVKGSMAREHGRFCTPATFNVIQQGALPALATRMMML